MATNSSACKTMTESELMAAVRKNDRAAFGELYDRYADRLLLFLRRMLGNDPEKARDVLQEVFMRVLRSADRFQEGRSLTTWIYTIAVNLCKNEYRRIAVRQNVEDGVEIESLPDRETGTEQQTDLKLFQGALESELEKLPAHLRSTFLLRFQSGLTVREIAGIMACSPGTVKSRLFYMSRNLAEVLKPYNPYNTEIS